MDLGKSIVLGVVQGLTEFLPISSDGHLALGAALLGIRDPSLTMVVLLHAGTLLATLLVFREDVVAILAGLFRGFRAPSEYLASDAGKEVSAIVVASIPTALIGLSLEDAVEPWSRDLRIVGACLLLSAAFVYSTFRTRGATGSSLGWRGALAVGVVQGLAVLPGLSRSGTTIATAMALGLAGPSAFRLSFLLSLPAVAGACLLELTKPGAFANLGVGPLAGATVAFFVGLGALVSLRDIVSRGRFHAFAFYLVPLATVVLLISMRA